jgi:hypothetical protein
MLQQDSIVYQAMIISHSHLQSALLQLRPKKKVVYPVDVDSGHIAQWLK